MIPPYTGPTSIPLGPLHLQLFGALVVSGVLVGHRVVLKLAAERGVPVDEMRSAAAWALGAGFFGAHLVDVVFYHPEKITRDGILTIFALWDGISSYGGFLGALAGLALRFRQLGRSWWTEADILVQGLVSGWIFGRLACTLTMDHPGTLTSFPLAFAAAGGARHNLGFYELLWTLLVLVPAIFLLRAREKRQGYRPGIYVATLTALYAPARFLMDTLRATDLPHADPRWHGLTAAQGISMVLFVFALAWLGNLRSTPVVASR